MNKVRCLRIWVPEYCLTDQLLAPFSFFLTWSVQQEKGWLFQISFLCQIRDGQTWLAHWHARCGLGTILLAGELNSLDFKLFLQAPNYG